AVLADTATEPTHLANHNDRPEVRAARLRGSGHAWRRSDSTGHNQIYVALPLVVPPVDGLVLRGAVDATAAETATAVIQRRLVLLGALLALLALSASLGLARQVARPLEEMRVVARQYAAGDLSQRLQDSETYEVAGLAAALNDMAAELDDRMRTVLRQRNELEAVLASMVEGVLAVDHDERIIRLNRAASLLFEVAVEPAAGRTVQEVIRHAELQRLLRRTIQTRETVEGQIELHGDPERLVRVVGMPLRDHREQTVGALLVLEDLTRLRRLESVRRDFVANVSHELRTPITSIKGFVETLLEGEHDPAATRHFLGIVQRQSDRLHQIIEDLLMLSKVEEGEQATITREPTDLRQVLQAAVQACGLAASEKAITVHCECAPLRWSVNAALLEEAVVNLLDNALKYSDRNSTVTVRATANGALDIAVIDHGAGIAPEHLSRLFERFYRVDKARSRNLGGTGLGLAIVKHIARAHGGQVGVRSALGEGSTFTITLPR
ncbi:MAG: PAS domain-containing protein, partial [Fimbriimonadaceae bacterium]|nr:PAS domain-containing protein [Fimbriimonadaceae bacterium]